MACPARQKPVSCLADRVLSSYATYEDVCDMADLSLDDLCGALCIPKADVEYLWSESPGRREAEVQEAVIQEPPVAPAVKERQIITDQAVGAKKTVGIGHESKGQRHAFAPDATKEVQSPASVREKLSTPVMIF